MKVSGKHYKTVWFDSDRNTVCMIDQTKLPFSFEIIELKHHSDTAKAIKNMLVRGAGAIGATAGFAMAQAFVEARESEDGNYVEAARELIEATRPTAVNLFYATNKVYTSGQESVDKAIEMAYQVAADDESDSQKIGEYGNELLKDKCRVLTHCNAGWLAFVDYGTALSPIYKADEAGKDPFVFVDETRPRGQGARLTAWELQQAGIRHKIIADNAAAFYMQKGEIDIVITGADRIAANGDTANKIGTLEKAILAKEFGIPFYIAAPFSTIDFDSPSGNVFNIEERSDDELLYHEGPDEEGVIRKIRMASPDSEGLNPAFDVTPAKYIAGIITERGIIKTEDLLKNK
ncbi:MAG: S-methyl-5-thioribose-1-phosphate isomerase [Marinilabiliaceae bacterium]|nr:S-methyl-5-thioribose-1-phosphate isomerase [Marinilabiliaceae bacterium]